MVLKIKRYLFVALLVIVVLVVSIGLGLVPVNLFFAKTTISEAVGNSLGAELDIRGSLRIRLGFRPALYASEITLISSGTADQPLVQIDSLTIRPRLLDALSGSIHLRGLDASGIVFDYCPDQLPLIDSEPGGLDLPSIAVDKLRLEDIQPRCTKTELRLAFLPDHLDLNASAPLDKPVRLEIKSRNSDESMLLTAVGASLESLLQNPSGYPVELQLSGFNSELRISSIVRNPLSEPELNARIQLDSERPSVLMDVFGVEIPDLETLRINLDVRARADEVRLERLEGTLGGNRFTLTGLAKNFSARPYFEIDAQLAHLDLEQLAEDLDENAGEGNPDWASLQPIFNVLAQFDARAQVKIDRLLNAPLQVDNLVFDISLDDGFLSLDQSELLLAGSPVTAQATLNMRSKCAQLTSEVRITNADVGYLNALLKTGSTIDGRVDQLTVRSSSCGSTLDEHFGSFHTNAATTHVIVRYADSELPLAFDSLEAEFAWNQPGRLSFAGQVLGETLSADIGFGSVAAMITGKIWPLSVTAKGAESLLNLSGNAAFGEGRIDLDVVLDFDVSRFGSLHAWIGADPASQLAFSGRTRLSLDDGGLALDQLDITVGQSNLMGKMSWPGSEGDLPMSFDLQSDRLDFNELAGLFPESVENTQTNKSDRTEPWSEIEWIDAWFNLPSIDIDLAVTHVVGNNFDIAGVNLHGRLRERLIEDGRLSLLFEEMEIEGAIEVDLRETPWRVSYEFGARNIDVGRLLAKLNLGENVVARADRMDFRYVSEGQSISQLAENSRLESKIESLHWIVEFGAENRSYEFHLSELELTAAPASPLTWHSTGQLNGVPIRAWMRSPGLAVIFDRNLELPLSLVISVGNEVSMLQTVIDRNAPDSLAATLVVSGQRMDPQSVNFSELESPLGEYVFRSKVTLKEGELIFSSLDAQIGSSRASGHVDIRREETGHRVNIFLNSPYLETEDLVQWTKNRRVASQLVSGRTLEKPVGQIPEGGIFSVITQQIINYARENIIDIRVNIEELRSAGILLGKAQMGLLIDKNEFRLDPMQISLPGGNVDAKYTTRQLKEGLETALNIHIESLEYGGLLRLLDPESEARGRLYLDTALISRSPDTTQVVQNLEGHFDLVVFPEDIEAGFLDLWASNLIFALLPKGSASGKKLNCMVARFEVDNGVMKSRKTFLDLTDIIIHGRGTIDLARQELDLLFAPQAKREKFLSISTPIAVTGSFGDFNVGIARGGFLTTMIRLYYGLIYVPWKWLTGERFPADGMATCFNAMDWDLP